MILLPFFDFLAGFRFRKIALKSDVHSLRRPWLRLLFRVLLLLFDSFIKMSYVNTHLFDFEFFRKQKLLYTDVSNWAKYGNVSIFYDDTLPFTTKQLK